MQRLVDIEIDQEFQLHTSYHNDFFLLRTKVLVDRKSTEIRTVKEGNYEGPVLNVCHSGSTSSTKLWRIANTVSPILHRYGVYHVDTFYYEQSPLFHTVFTSESCLRKFLLAMGELKSALESQLHSLLSHDLKSVLCDVPESPPLTIEVQPELFLVSPNQLKSKGAELHLMTMENHSDLLAHWKSSKLFEFSSLYQEEVHAAQPPHITLHPRNRNDVLPGGSIIHLVRATGTEPLTYKWQWKPAGTEGEQHEWQDLSCDDTTFQEVEGGLKLTGVQACNAGDYRCVVSNSAGSEISQGATLTVVPELVDLVRELRDVTDWIPFGLFLGIKMPRLEEIQKECQTIGDRQIKMLNEWQNNVTPTWSPVVHALVGIGMRRLASELAQKHGIQWAPSKLPDYEPLTNIPQRGEATGSMLLQDLQRRTANREQDRRRLTDSEERLTQTRKSKIAVDEKVSQIMSHLEKLRTRVQKIVQEKKIIEIELQSKRQLLSQLRSESKKDEVITTLLEEKIQRNVEDAEKLEKELKRKESDLVSAQQESRTRQEELSQARAELKRKHVEVQEIQQEYEKLASCYDIGMEQRSKLIQLLAADKEDMQEQLVGLTVESESKSRQIEGCNLNVRQLTGDVETLSTSLQKKEARAAQFEREFQTYQQASSTPEQLLESITLTAQIAELERRLQDAEYQKQQAESEREAAVQGVEAMQTFFKMLHMQLDEPPRVKLRWRKGTDMLLGMTYYPQTVQLHTTLYVGGGHSGSTSEECTVLQCELTTDSWSKLTTDSWSKLPEYQYYYFGMSLINGCHLTLVGGKDKETGKVTNKLGVWDPSSQQWTQPYPPMITPRCLPEVATYNKYLLAAGGYDGCMKLTTVEVLDVRASEQWLTATQLPVPCELKTSAILHDNWYIITNRKKVMYTSLPELCTTPQTVTSSATNTTPAQWCRLRDAPLEDSTTIALHGSLLTVGGSHDDTPSTAIHFYHLETKAWRKVGEVPTPRSYCSVTLLPSGKFLVSGGQDQHRLTALIDIATIVD